MKQFFYILLLISHTAFSQGVPYMLTATNEPYVSLGEDAIDITKDAPFWDDDIYVEELEEPFKLFGKKFGVIGMNDFNFILQTNESTAALIFPTSEDVVDRKTKDELLESSKILMLKSGEPGERRYEVELVNGALYEDNDLGDDMSLLNMQCSIDEKNGQIVYHFGQSTGKLDKEDFGLGNTSSGFIQELDQENNVFNYIYFISGKDTDVELSYLENMTPEESEQDSFLVQYSLETMPKSGTKYVLSPMTTAVNDFDDLILNVYPNPTVSSVQIMGLQGDYLINVYGLDGKKRASYDRNVIQLDKYESGIYIIEVVQGDDRFISKIQKI